MILFVSRTFLIAIVFFLVLPIGRLRGQEQIISKRVFEEKNGFLIVEAEDFHEQAKTAIRKWYMVNDQKEITELEDVDAPHNDSASGGAYLEILPDTRTNHEEKLIAGENFSNEPGKLAILSYPVKISTPGRYYIWVSAYSTGTEDNGLHVGLNGAWPESGQRMQWCEGKNSWYWESKQRTEKEHCGVPHQIYLDIKEPGLYSVQFSMREDGFEMDAWLMTTDIDFNPREVLRLQTGGQ